MEKIFISSEPGLKELTANELFDLGLIPSAKPQENNRPSKSNGVDIEKGGVEFPGSLKAIYRANLSLRTASRVLIRLGSFNAAAFSELRKKAGRLHWEKYLAKGQPVALKVTCRKSRLYHSDAVKERVIGAIEDRLGQKGRARKFDKEKQGDAAQLFLVRLVNDLCTISVDSSGELLHRRGYRLATAKAPLRETLAAGVIAAARWDREQPLIDPFCGSGTIAIEAARWSRGIAPGNARHFAFMDWPSFEPLLWKTVLSDHEQHCPRHIPRIFASDRDAGAIKLARENAERAGVADAIEFSCKAVSSIEPTGTGWVITNPPYGLRTGHNKDLRNLYAQLGKVLTAKCPGWRFAVLCNDLQLLGNMGLDLDTSRSMMNGGVPVKLAKGQVEEGSGSS